VGEVVGEEEKEVGCTFDFGVGEGKEGRVTRSGGGESRRFPTLPEGRPLS